MPAPDFETLAHPVSDDDPCGPDLDAEGDTAYLNFFASAESTLPQSYFRAREPSGGELRLFEPKMLPFDSYFEAARPFLERTRDLRLLVLLAKFSVLSRDLDGFLNCLKAIATLLERHWDDVHPRAEDGDFAFRAIAVEALDVVPTVTMPLQFLPLLRHPRLGSLSYRTYLVAKEEANAAEGEATLDMASVARILDECDLAELSSAQDKLATLLATLQHIQQVWASRNEEQSISFNQLFNDTGAMAAWLGDHLKRRNPDVAIAGEEAAADAGTEGDAMPSEAGGALSPIASHGDAAAALDAVARYFMGCEPSSPAILLVQQAQRMVGKSFAEVLRLLVPAHVEQAAISLGRERAFDLPVERMAVETEGAEGFRGDLTSTSSYDINNRTEAFALIDRVAAYFRAAEPTSPIPLLLERVRDLGHKDFLSLLKLVLPQDALRNTEASS